MKRIFETPLAKLKDVLTFLDNYIRFLLKKTEKLNIELISRFFFTEFNKTC